MKITLKITLTNHVQHRRAKGNIPAADLKRFAEALLSLYKLSEEVDGFYKFRRGGAQAVFHKNGNKVRFITFFGSTGWVMNKEYSLEGFNCSYQGINAAERQQIKILRRLKSKEYKEQNMSKEQNISAKPTLKGLSKDKITKLKKGTFDLIQLSKSERLILKDLHGHNPNYLFVSKYNYQFIELLNIDGVSIKTVTNMYFLFL